MDIVDKIIQFYKDNKELALLFFGGVFSLLLNKIIPYLAYRINDIFDWLLDKIGGKFYFGRIQREYLNWVVFINRDLYLTGIIGTGQKPLLEQIFVSLKITKGFADENIGGDNEIQPQQPISDWEYFKTTIISTANNLYKQTKLLLNKIISPHKANVFSFFQESPRWKIKLFFSRDNFDEFSSLIVFVIIPILILTIIQRESSVGLFL